MCAQKFDNIWRLMARYTFEVDVDVVNENLSCLICKKLMIDACQTACGCQYCYQCISSYIGTENKFCPGGKDECQEEYLVMERDVMKNVRMNNRICKLTVRCPNETCQLKMEILAVEDHLRTCRNEAARCPYAAVGCDKSRNHPCQSEYAHTQLLMECINNLKNEFDSLKERFEESQSVIESLREDSRLKDVKFEKMLTEIREKDEAIKTVREEVHDKETRIMTLENAMVEVRDDLKFTFSKMMQERRNEEIQREKNMHHKEEETRNFVDKEMNKVGLELDELRKTINVVSATMDNDRYDSERKTIFYLKWNKLCPSIGVDFVWKIDELSFKRKAVYSDVFQSNNHHFVLSVYIAGDSIALWCTVAKGDKDDSLQWPMKRAVTLSILNQKSMRVHRSETYQYDSYNPHYKCAFNKPTSDKNEYSIGNANFLSYPTIVGTPTLGADCSIIVCCTVGDIFKGKCRK